MYFFIPKEKRLSKHTFMRREKREMANNPMENCLRRRAKVDNSICVNEMMEGMNGEMKS